jgi:glycosyltransferase involved in cell wall biosynthesis
VHGAGPAARNIVGIEAREWNEAREVDDLQSMDVGIMPVPDDPWGRGKCGYKLIQYMACGLPAIASPVGVNKVIIDDGVDGFLAQTEADWTAALETLARDAGLRRQMGSIGRQKIVAHYSLQSQQQVVLEAFRKAVLGQYGKRRRA